MYRIELSPGEETAFRSIEELAVAIRRKVVTSRARIYHNATRRWLPIQFHPHYKLALSMPLTQADLVAGPPVTPLSALKLGEPAARETSSVVPSSAQREAAAQAALSAWPEPKSVEPAAAIPAGRPAQLEAAPPPPIKPGTMSPEPRRFTEPLRSLDPQRSAPVRSWRPIPAERPSRHKGSPRRRKPLRALRVALAGAVLIACSHLVLSAAAPEDPSRARTPRRLVVTPPEALKNASPRTVAAVLPVLQTVPVPGLSTPSSSAPVAAPGPRHAPIDSIAEALRADSALAGVPAREIQPAPPAGEITAAVPRETGSLAPQVVDSSGKKTLKRILRTIGGSPAADRPLP